MGKTRAKNRNREDFSDLLKSLHSQKKRKSNIKPLENCAYIFSNNKSHKNFQKLVSSENILYLYQKSQNIIHDKHCEYAKAIFVDDLEALSKYNPTAIQCPHCELITYLRMGAEDFARHGKYERMFKKMRVGSKLLRKIYLEMRCKTRICDLDTIQIMHGDELWKIRALNDKGRVELSHNDYRLSYYGERKRYDTYHIQSEGCRNTNISYSLEVINRHKKHRAYCEYTIREQQIIRLLKFNSKETQENMADMLGVSVSTISKTIQSLKKSNTIIRVGGSRNGYWKVVM